MRGARIGRRREQTDDAVFADQVAGIVETLDADVIEIDAPMNARMNIGLGDDERTRLLQKRHDFRRDFEQLAATAQYAQVALAHDAEPGLEPRHKRVAVAVVAADADEREIVGQQPLQKLDRFRKFVDRQRRRTGLHLGNDSLDAGAHRLPVLHRQPHFAEHGFQRGREVGAFCEVVDRFEMNMNKAFALKTIGVRRTERNKKAAVAPDTEHRMRHQTHVELAIGDFSHHRIDQERHVVVINFDDGDRLALARVRQFDILAANVRRARRTLFQKTEGAFGEHGDVPGAIAEHIVRHHPRIKLRDETGRYVVAAAR